MGRGLGDVWGRSRTRTTRAARRGDGAHKPVDEWRRVGGGGADELSGAGEGVGVEREEEEEQRGNDVQRRGIGGLEEAVEGAGEVVEDAVEVDILLRDAQREGVAEGREHLVGGRERELLMRRLGGGRGGAGRR